MRINFKRYLKYWFQLSDLYSSLFTFTVSQFFNMTNFSAYNFANQKALIRVDFNVPLDKKTFEIKDDTRMKAAIPTIKKILEKGVNKNSFRL